MGKRARGTGGVQVTALARSLLKLVLGEENDSAHRRTTSKVAENEIFKHFGEFDSDHDGALSKDQFHAALAAKPFELPFAQREKLHRCVNIYVYPLAYDIAY